MHPSESYLIFKGKLMKSDGAVYIDNDTIALTNNGLFFAQEIELYKPGQATMMLGTLEYPDDFSKLQGLNEVWYKDTDAMLGSLIAGFEIRHKYIMKNPLSVLHNLG